jgi:hypothetical protein
MGMHAIVMDLYVGLLMGVGPVELGVRLSKGKR